MALPHPLIITGSGFDAGEFFYGCNADVTDGPPGSGSRGLAPGEDGLSTNFNRAAFALAENDEYLHGKITRDIGTPEVAALTGHSGTTIVIDPSNTSGDVLYDGTLYLGEATWPGAGFTTQERLDQLFQLLDADYNEVLVGGSEVKVTSLTGNSLGAGFVPTATTLHLNATLPSGNYRIAYLAGTTLEDLPPYAFSLAGLRGLEELPGEDRPADRVTYAGGPAWHDGTTNPATDVEAQLDKLVTDLVADAGTDRIGSAAISGTYSSVSVGSAKDQIAELLGVIDSIKADHMVLESVNTTKYTVGGSVGLIYSVAISPVSGRWVVVDHVGSVTHSLSMSDGPWTTDAQAATVLKDVIYSNTLSKFVAVGRNASGAGVYTDADGTGTWTAATLSAYASGSYEFDTVIDDETSGYLIAAGGDYSTPTIRAMLRSSDGTTWSLPTTQPSGFTHINDLAVNGSGIICAAGYDDAAFTNLGKISRSTDGGDTWSTVFTGGSQTPLTGITYDPINQRWLATGMRSGASSGLYRSTDATGTSWTQLVAPASNWNAWDVTSNGRGLVMAWGYDAKLRWSLDGGSSWSVGRLFDTTVGASAFNVTHYVGDRFIMIDSAELWLSFRRSGVVSGLDV